MTSSRDLPMGSARLGLGLGLGLGEVFGVIGMAGVSLLLLPVATGITVLLSVIFTIGLARRGRSALLSPTLGIFVVIFAGIIAIFLNLKAFT